MRWLVLFARNIIAADSARATSAWLAGFVVVVVGPPLLFREPVYVLAWLPSIGTVKAGWFTVGQCLSAVMVIAYMLFIAGLTRAHGQGPWLNVEDDLIADTGFGLFRLRVWNSGGGLLAPTGSLLWVEGDGVPEHDATTPLPLNWMHQPPSLSFNESANLDIAWVQETGHPTERLRFAGIAHKPDVLLQPVTQHMKSVVFCVSVFVPGTKKKQERVFALERDLTKPFTLRSIRLRAREPRWWGRTTSLRSTP